MAPFGLIYPLTILAFPLFGLALGIFCAVEGMTFLLRKAFGCLSHQSS